MRKKRVKQRKRRHERLRKKVLGTKQKPRLCVYRSLKNLSAQLVDDSDRKTLLSLSTFDKGTRDIINYGGNIKAAEALGKLLAEKAIAKGIKTIIFDRGGYLYHGRVKAFAEAARKQGLIF